MISLLADLGIELLIKLPLYVIPALLAFAFARWCAKRKIGKLLCSLALAALGIAAVYGLLRAAGVILYPDDKFGLSMFMYGSSSRDEGVRLAVPCLLALAAGLLGLRNGQSGAQDSAAE